MLRLIKFWIFGSAACVSAGWILSVFGEVNRTGYSIAIALTAMCLVIVYKKRRAQGESERDAWPKWNIRRFRRPLPLLFLLALVLAMLGGAIYAPNNYDGLSYRFPRMLHWWAASQWVWIVTPNMRMNLAGTNFEWLMMPFFIFTHSDRFFFLINLAAYLILPSLTFLTFRECGATRRVSWFWMWVLPMALCYAMQAGSISNDTIAATYFMSAIFFAFHAERTGAVRYLWLSFLAAGLMTGVKANNLPLLLPIAWALWPAIRLVEKRFVLSLGVAGISAIISFLPSAYLNYRHTGAWDGDPNNIGQLKLQKPLAGILGNGLQLGLQSLEPPFLPLARTAETWVWNRFPTKVQTVLKNDFPRFGVGFRELPQEESSGLGIVVTVMALISAWMVWRMRARFSRRRFDPARQEGMAIGCLTWVALMAFMAKLGSESTSRLLAAYYPLLILPVVLARAQDYLVRKKWYQYVGITASLVAVVAVILTPSRPLWPDRKFLAWADARFPQNRFVSRAKTVFDTYGCRNDFLASLCKDIPESTHTVGVVDGVDDVEASLWRPYGGREVIHVNPGDYQGLTNVQWVVIKDWFVDGGHPEELSRWLKRNGGTIVSQQRLTEKAGMGPEAWSVIRFGGIN